jgi:type IV secretion system protein VirB10
MSYGMNVRSVALLALGSLVIAAPLFSEQSAQQAPPDQKPDQAAQSPSSAAPAANTTAANNAPSANISAQFIVPSGTRLPLVLHNAISTRNAQPGDPVYLETVFPVILNGRIAIPAGSYVQGEVTEAKRPGKGKGTGEVRIRLTTLILPNGYTVNFDAIPTNTGTNGGEYADKEGQITKDRDRAADAGTVIKTTGAGAGIGGIAGGARGLGVGAGVGAAVGLAAVLMSRGPDLELPRGTSVDIMLDRPLPLDPSKINFTDPGHASSLPGPPTRQPTRSFPF